MQAGFEVHETSRPNRDVLEIASHLDAACAAAIVNQARRSLRAGVEAVVVDLSHAEPLSLAGLAQLLERAQTAGVLSRLVFQSEDPQVGRLFANMRKVQVEYAA